MATRACGFEVRERQLAEGLSCALGMLNSLEVKVLCPT